MHAQLPSYPCINPIRFQYGRLQTVGLTLPDQYELVDNLVAYDRPWKTLPIDDITVWTADDSTDSQVSHAVLGIYPINCNCVCFYQTDVVVILSLNYSDVRLNNVLMKEGLQILVSSHDENISFMNSIKNCVEGVLPICLYAVDGTELTDQVVPAHNSLIRECKRIKYCYLWCDGSVIGIEMESHAVCTRASARAVSLLLYSCSHST